MNDPIPNHYDAGNAQALCQFASAAYEPDRELPIANFQSSIFDSAETDTRAIVCQSETDVIVAFRGTQSLRNFVTDLRCRRVPLFGGAGAEVHEGFQQALDSIWPALAAGLNRRLALAPALRLWLTGHSLGAALARLCAWRISNLKSEISNSQSRSFAPLR